MRKFIMFMILITAGLQVLTADDLIITSKDVYIKKDSVSGYHLWIRSKPGLKSVLITESTADPSKKEAVYALRAKDKNSINGNEKRILNGRFLDPERKIFSLIDSTPEPDARFGQAFHIFIPQTVMFGYPWGREGSFVIENGTWLNMRTFPMPYADYTNGFRDNPFILNLKRVKRVRPAESSVARRVPDDREDPVNAPVPIPKDKDKSVDIYSSLAERPEMPDFETNLPSNIKKINKDDFNKGIVNSMEDAAKHTGGEIIFSEGAEDVSQQVKEILEKVEGPTLDLVLAIDTTASMKDDIDQLQKRLIPRIWGQMKRFRSSRIGLVLYRDYKEEYLTRKIEFSEDVLGFQTRLDEIEVKGGKDIPEAVYEALHTSISKFIWEADSRLVILIGDAPPHPEPRGKITKEMVYRSAEENEVSINAIILPEKK